MAEEVAPLPRGKFFYIVGKESGLVLEIQDYSLEPGSLVVLGEKRDIRDEPEQALCQMWYNCQVTNTLRCRANAKLAFTLNDDDQVCIDVVDEDEGVYHPSDRQLWTFNVRKNHIKATIGGESKYVEVADHETSPGAPLVAYEESGEDNQRFHEEYLPSPYFLIVSEMSGLCLEVSTGMLGGVKGGQDLVTSKIDGKDNQLWYEDEQGQLRCKVDGYAVQVDFEAGQNIETASYSKQRETQHWHLMPNGIICNRHRSELVFDVANRKCKDGAKVVVWEYKSVDNQWWRKDTNIPVKKKKAKKSKKTKKSKKERESDDDDSEDDDDSDDED